jgi:hypothetical protein
MLSSRDYVDGYDAYSLQPVKAAVGFADQEETLRARARRLEESCGVVQQYQIHTLFSRFCHEHTS